MDEIDLLQLIKRRFAALLANVHPRADPKLAAEVPATLAQTDSDLPAVFMRARRVLEIIVLDIYRRELPTAKPKPLADMIEALYEQQGLVSKRVAANLHYIRVNGNLIIHPQDDGVEIRPGDAEPVLLVFLSVVEWYLAVYLPERLGEAPARTPTLPHPPNPYRGLLAFREADAANWFGREPDAGDLLAAVARQPLVAVVGPSGSGKSSLVYAGVVPHLRPTSELRIADFRPRGRPFPELAQALVALWPIDPTDRLAQARQLAMHLAEGQVTLTDGVRETLRQSGGGRLLLIADQFEELYTLGQSGDDTQSFTDLLVQALQDILAVPNRSGPPELCLLLTLRADFLGHALAHPGFAALLDHCPPKLLGPVEDRARLRAIIEQPARGAGVVLEDLLPERILRDLSQLPGTADQVGGASLPLLEFALAQLWGQQQERRLTHRGYEELGGIQQALSRHADRVLARLDPADQARMRHVLVQMVRPGEGTEDTRQVATRDQLRQHDWPLVVRLADADTRLVVTGHDETTDQDTAEIVHEALIRHWQPLRDWIDADRAFRLWQNGLRQAMAEWERTNYDSGALLAGIRLAEAEERMAAHRTRIGEADAAYISASISARDAEAARQAQQLNEKQRLQRRVNIALSALLGSAIMLSSLAVWQWQVAEQQREELQSSINLAENALAAAEEQRLIATNEASKAREAVYRERAQLLAARINLAKAHQERARSLLNESQNALRTSHIQEAILHALASQTQPVGGRYRLDADALEPLMRFSAAAAFTQEWKSPPGFLGQRLRAAKCRGSLGLCAGVSENGDINVASIRDGSTLQTLSTQGTQVNAVAISPDGRFLASGTGVPMMPNNALHVWDLQDARIVRSANTHQSPINAVAFSHDGNMVATASGALPGGDNSIRVWNVKTLNQKLILEGHTSSVNAIAFSPDGERIASASGSAIGEDNSIRVWDLESGEELAALVGHKSAIKALAWTQDGSALISGSGGPFADDYSARLWDLASRETRAVFRGHSGTITSLAVTPDGSTLLTGSDDNTIRSWDLEGGSLNDVFTSHQAPITSVSVTPDASRAVTTSADGSAAIFRLQKLKPIGRVSPHSDPVFAVAFSPDGKTIATASGGDFPFRDNSIRLSDYASGVLIHRFDAHKSSVRDLAFSPNGAVLATASGSPLGIDNSVRIWDVNSGRLLHLLGEHRSAINTVAISGDGASLATGSGGPLGNDNAVRLFSTSTGRMTRILYGHSGPVHAVRFSPVLNMLATGSDKGEIFFWDASDGVKLKDLHTGGASIHALAFSPEGDLLASGGADGVVRLWKVRQTEQIAELRAHESSVRAVGFSPDGRLIASASEDHSIVVWDARSGTQLATLRGHSGEVTAVAFALDSDLLASGSSDHTVRLWRIRNARLLSHGAAPSARASLVVEALQRLWNLRIEGLGVEHYNWESDPLGARGGHHRSIEIDVRSVAEYGDPDSAPIFVTFDISALLGPPPPGMDKLDQFLDWLAEQERLEPRLRPQ
jgi:WD40 repeat protein